MNNNVEVKNNKSTIKLIMIIVFIITIVAGYIYRQNMINEQYKNAKPSGIYAFPDQSNTR